MENLNTEQLRNHNSIGGWLALLCIILIIISPLRTLYNFIPAYDETQMYFDQFPGIRNIFYVDGIFSLIITTLSIRAGIALYRINPNAVKIAKNYFLIFLGYAIIGIFLPFMAGLPSESNEAMIPEILKSTIQSFAFFGIWYSYLCVSKRVKATYITHSSD